MDAHISQPPMPVLFWLHANFLGNWQRNRIWNNPVCRVILSPYSSIYSKVEEYKTEMHVNIKYEWEKIAVASNFISLPIPQQTRSGSANYRLLHRSVHLQKMMSLTLFRLTQTSCEWQIHWTFPFSHIMSLCEKRCVHHILHSSYDTSQAVPCTQEHHIWWCFFFLLRRQILKGGPYNHKRVVVQK